MPEALRERMSREEVNVLLRDVTPEDEAFLFELYASTRMEELAGLGWDENQKRSFITMQFLARERSQPRVDDRLIVLDGRAVGRMLVDRGEAAILLRDIAVLPEYRNTGIGTRLLEDLKQEAAAAGKPVALHVLASNPAVRLYERLGFRRVDGADTHYETAYLEMKWVPATS